MEIFVLEESVPCPHFTDKKTEPPPPGCDLPRVHPAQQGGAPAASTGLCSHFGGRPHLRPESLLSPRGLASLPADSPRGSEKGSEHLSSPPRTALPHICSSHRNLSLKFYS